jgi:molybdopterin synthase sulfur carrier subunit
MNVSNPIKIKLVAFGVLQEIIGAPSIFISCDPNLESCKENLIKQYPALAKQAIQYAINHQLASENIALTNGSEIALLPPFSGG